MDSGKKNEKWREVERREGDRNGERESEGYSKGLGKKLSIVFSRARRLFSLSTSYCKMYALYMLLYTFI